MISFTKLNTQFLEAVSDKWCWRSKLGDTSRHYKRKRSDSKQKHKSVQCSLTKISVVGPTESASTTEAEVKLLTAGYRSPFYTHSQQAISQITPRWFTQQIAYNYDYIGSTYLILNTVMCI